VERACQVSIRFINGTAGLQRLSAQCRWASCIATDSRRCCRPRHPQVHPAREWCEPRSTTTRPSPAQSSDARAVGSAKVLAMSAVTGPPHESSDVLVCQCELEQRLGGQPNRLFPILGHYSQFRGRCAGGRMVGSALISVVSTSGTMQWANTRTDYKTRRCFTPDATRESCGAP
jgi:hypothetical protein